MTFGAFLAEQRALTGVSVQDLADRAGLDRLHVALIERGLRLASVNDAVRLAAGLDLSLAELLAAYRRVP
jgi:transcriptional regulator with XRE-family HTH domain